MFRPVLVLFAFALAVPVFAGDEPKLPGPKIEWPEVKGFTRDKPFVYPEARLGYSSNYKAPGIVVTVYVYDNGQTKIPTGVKSDVVKSEMKEVIATLEEAKKLGRYKDVKLVGKEEVVSLGKGKTAPSVLRQKFEVERVKDGKALSEAYITGYKDHFVKLRITYDPADQEAAEKKIAELLEAVGDALKERRD